MSFFLVLTDFYSVLFITKMENSKSIIKKNQNVPRKFFIIQNTNSL